MVRDPAVAGVFYPEDAQPCSDALDACLAAGVSRSEVEGRIVAGVLPHAGWACSGEVAASVFRAIASQRTPGTVVLLGAVHRPKRPEAAIFPSGCWNTPLGSIRIDDRLAERVMGHTNLIASDAYAHEPEHSIEVHVPFIQRLWPEATLLPIMVPPTDRACEVGDAVGRTLSSYGYDAIVLASSDLTHYGSRYGFVPMGVGEAGLDWAKDVNDRRMIDRMVALDAEVIVAEASEHRNACGAGALAAAIAAARLLGADRGHLLQHATSRETVGLPSDKSAVGYAGVVFTSPS